MGKLAITQEKIVKLVKLRQKGFSLKEIASLEKIGIGTAHKYLKSLVICNEGKKILEQKRFPSKLKSRKDYLEALALSKKVLSRLSKKDKILIAVSLYWGEGTKKDFNLINGDPALIYSFLEGIYAFGVEKDRIRISIRYFENQDKQTVTDFWLRSLKLKKESISGFEKVASGTKNKLEYGMCRVRIVKPSFHHKLLINLIGEIKRLS